MLNIILTQILPGITALAVFGYLLARWSGKRPSGLLNLSEMTSQISGNPNWQLPIILAGLLISYMANIGAYAVFFIGELIRFVAWLIRWIYEKILLFIYNNIIRQTLVLSVLLLVRYCFIMPLKVLVAVVHAVPDAIRWRSLGISTGSGMIFFLLLSVGHFMAYLLEAPALATVFTFASTVLLATYLTGRLVFDNRSSGNKALSFALIIVSIAVSGFVLAFLLNLGDALQKGGGILTGFAYAPSVISMTATLLACLSALFVANIGAVYINRSPGQGLIGGLKGFVEAVFQRSWYFLFQVIFTLVVGIFLMAIPYLVGSITSTSILESFVFNQMDSRQSQLQSELEAVSISGKIDQYCSADTSDNLFNTAVSKITREAELQVSLEENARYRNYYKKEMTFISLAEPLTTKEQHRQHIEGLETELNQIKKQFNEEEENSKQYLDQLKKQLEEVKASYAGSEGPNSYLESMEKNYDRMKLESDRRSATHDSIVVAKTNAIKYWESSSPYDAGSFIAFLLSKTVLWAILLSVFFTLFAFSTQRVYDLYNSSYLAELIRAEQQRSPYQPWAAYLFATPVYVLLFWILSSLLGINVELPKIGWPNAQSTEAVETAPAAVPEGGEYDQTMSPGDDLSADDALMEYNMQEEIALPPDLYIDSAASATEAVEEEMPPGVEGM